MGKTIYLHVGFHKTGTTALQESIAVNAKNLEQCGVLYPLSKGRSNHHNAAMGLASRGWGWRNRGQKTVPQSEWKKLVKKTIRAKSSVLLSSEFFSELTPPKISQLRSDFQGFEVKIVFTLRALDKLFPSSYQQALKSGIQKTYEEWLKQVLDDHDNTKRMSFWKRNQHAKVIADWISVFGKENVVLQLVDEKQPQRLFIDFASIIGVPTETIAKTEGGGLNRSLTYREAELLRQVNTQYPKSRDWSEYLIFVRRGIANSLSSAPADPADEKLKTPKWAIERIEAISTHQLAELKKLDLNAVGNWSSLDVGTIEGGSNKPVNSISLESAAALFASFGLDMLPAVHPLKVVRFWLPALSGRSPKFLTKPLQKFALPKQK